MQDVTQDGLVPPGPGPALGRVSEACARCRRQKLKCDTRKPCTMCVRSGMDCQPRCVLAPTPRRRKVNNTPTSHGVSTTRGRGRSQTAPRSPTIVRPTDSVHGLGPTTPAAMGPTTSPADTQQFGANRSAISLAMNVYNNLGTHAPADTSTIPGDPSPSSPSGSTWTLQSMAMPSSSVMETLIDVYFDKMHWFIWIFHQPSFVAQARQVMSTRSWRREDMSKILVTLTVAAIGLKCAIQDTSLRGQELLASICADPRAMVDQIITEVRSHLLDLLDDSCIETVQVCLLLGAFYIFHGSPSLAWATIGLSVRASYALALHCTSEPNDPIATQVRRRCWNHLTVADTFASQIYGRPASLDPAFSALLPLIEMDDTAINISMESQMQQESWGDVTALTFHWLKYRLYEIIKETLSTFRVLQLHNPMTVEELQSLLDAVKHIDARLDQWHKTLPPLLNSDGPSESSFHPSSSDLYERHDEDEKSERDKSLHRIKLQALLLQITYDAAIILAHRPLLEYKLSSEYRKGVSKTTMEFVSKSYDKCVKAALRISRTPVMQFKLEFCMAFIFVHLFTAGVILCIPPTSQPLSSTAQEAKSGVFRIMQAAKALSPHSQIARHTERLLSDLLKLSLHREIDLAFQEERGIDMNISSAQFTGEDPQATSTQEAIPVEQQSVSGQGVQRGLSNESILPMSPASNSEVAQSSHQGADTDNFGDMGIESFSVFNNLMNAENSGAQHLDLQLDEAFGAFGQVMFNLMPDDPLNSWGWGKRSM